MSESSQEFGQTYDRLKPTLSDLIFVGSNFLVTEISGDLIHEIWLN